jgi:predicted transcriptional regulator
MKVDARPWTKGLRRLVAWHLARSEPLSVNELAELCQQRRENIAPRLTELADLGEAVCIGTRPRTSGKGRPQKLWRYSGANIEFQCGSTWPDER